MADAQINMIKQQLRPAGILDPKILALFDKTPREQFVPTAYHELAYMDSMIPLTNGQAMLSPILEAQILKVLTLKPTDKVLEVGTGTGYLTALLAQQAQHVYSIDSLAENTEQAQRNISNLEITNISLATNDASAGWDKQQPYDAIVITGSLDFLPKEFLQQLTLGGKLFVVINQGQTMYAYLITRLGEQDWTHHRLFETMIPPLALAKRKSTFKF